MVSIKRTSLCCGRPTNFRRNISLQIRHVFSFTQSIPAPHAHAYALTYNWPVEKKKELLTYPFFKAFQAHKGWVFHLLRDKYIGKWSTCTQTICYICLEYSLRMAKFIVFCFLVVLYTLSSAAPAMWTKNERLKLIELYKDIKKASKTVELVNIELPTLKDVTDECQIPALKCFVDNMNKLKIPQNLLDRMKARVPDSKVQSCQPCTSYAKMKSNDFIENLITLVQRIISSSF
ncbi:uncharacterized protein LOC120527625 isoform X1 [Polypterus senegalus]|uniref:uncharacterized protein LOC120527625 isoform X1 n=1 Tax=Polypterus senegalus TaxID=55291 RepID=UPI001966C4AD|nr:uncharacterized protein LOC120527625 isoform X1 [Polypterus senegalus]